MHPLASIRAAATRIACALASAAVSVLQFLLLISLLYDSVKLHAKMTSFLSLASMVAVGIVELAFLIFIFSYFWHAADSWKLVSRLLRVAGAQFEVFAGLGLLRLAVYWTFLDGRLRNVPAVLGTMHLLLLAVGLPLGLALLLIPWRRILQRRGEPELPAATT